MYIKIRGLTAKKCGLSPILYTGHSAKTESDLKLEGFDAPEFFYRDG